MKRILKFCYQMELIFSGEVRQHQFTLRMIPQTDRGQKIAECMVKIRPECAFAEDKDPFGNQYVYGTIEDRHTSFQVEIMGTAEVDSAQKEPVSEAEPLYIYPSGYTKPGDALAAYYKKYPRADSETEEDYAARLMHSIYKTMEYKKGVTGIHTTAEQALAAGEGVCQDYAHIMIAVLRMAGIPARYVVGMMEGEGFSHAWVEAAVSGSWVGYDPTNDRLAGDTYIRISHGRDYQDCIVNRGVFSGCVTQEQKVKVVVSEE